MKRTPMVAGNWKMNKTASEAVTLINELLSALKTQSGVDRIDRKSVV